MSNPYDKAHELATIIENEPSYLKVKEFSLKVMEKPDQVEKIDQFRREQMEVQRKQMLGMPLEPNELEKVNEVYEELMKDQEVKELLEAEQQLSQLFNDLNRILTGPLEKIYKK